MDSKPIAHLHELEEGKPFLLKLEGGKEIVLFKYEAQVFALENACPHMGGPLNEGEVENGNVTCPWHGWQFDFKTGESINCPGDDAQTIPLKVVGDEIFLA